MRTQDARRIPLPTLLAALGHTPVKQVQGECWYKSPFRQEQDASFKTDASQLFWYDHGLGRGGNIIDFAFVYFGVNNVGAALHELERTLGSQRDQLALLPERGTSRSPQQSAPVQRARAGKQPQEQTFTDVRVNDLHHPALRRYLASRGVDAGLSRRYLKEMHYRREGKAYFALAFPNDAGGYELRNAYFKGNTGGKAISTISRLEHAPDKIMLFEGFMDFLSALSHYKRTAPPCPTLVLNGVGQTRLAIPRLQALGARTVYTYLDRDAAGEQVLTTLQAALPEVAWVDKSPLYAGYKDFNAFLQAEQQRATQRELVME